MKRLILGLVAAGLLGVAAWSRTASDQTVPDAGKDVQIEVKPVNPWSNLKFNNQPSVFRFAILTDRTGSPRKGVFELAVDQLNMLQPEFVVSVGDLIWGGIKDEAGVKKEWQQFNGWIAKLQMPFFYVPGNHDFATMPLEKQWKEHFGRSYYHFVYKNVLFLMLNTEEPPRSASGSFSKEQLDYVKEALAKNNKVRWTMVFMHRPVWTYDDIEKTGLPEIETWLKGRPYTVFAGHKHTYKMFERKGQKYYMLATTGGGSGLRGPKHGEFDHLVWVTMKDTGPVLANLMMEGILPEDVQKAPPFPGKAVEAKPKTETGIEGH